MQAESDIIIDNRYKYSTYDLLETGNTCKIYSGCEVGGVSKKFAFKTEIKKAGKCCQLDKEIDNLIFLNDKKMELDITEFNIPQIYYHSLINGQTILVESLLGHNLKQIFSLCKHQFKRSTILLLVIKMIEQVQYLHSLHITHCDIKPEHFLFDRQSSTELINEALKRNVTLALNTYDKIYLIDFCNSQSYQRDDYSGHIQNKIGKKYYTNNLFRSIWTHLENEQSRRDDLESICYIMVYLFKGKLPWMNIHKKNKKEINERLNVLKLSISPKELCCDIEIPECEKLFDYVRGLQFNENPNYEYMKEILTFALHRENYNTVNDIIFNELEPNNYHIVRTILQDMVKGKEYYIILKIIKFIIERCEYPNLRNELKRHINKWDYNSLFDIFKILLANTNFEQYYESLNFILINESRDSTEVYSSVGTTENAV